MLIFESLTDEQIQKVFLVPEGEYKFQIAIATEKVSQNGNQGIDIRLKVTDPNDNKEKLIFDWLSKDYQRKLKRFCESVGLNDAYAKGRLHADECQLKRGSAKIGVKQNSNGDYTNSVIDYLPFENNQYNTNISAEQNNPNAFKDDDINF